MKLKFHWGTGITLFFILFLVAMITVVWYASRQDYFMVTDNYYEKGQSYESRLEMLRNANALKGKLKVTLKADSVIVILPSITGKDSVHGTLDFYRPNAPSLDVQVSLKLNKQGRQAIASRNLKSGRYILKATWFIANKGYYAEKPLFIP